MIHSKIGKNEVVYHYSFAKYEKNSKTPDKNLH